MVCDSAFVVVGQWVVSVVKILRRGNFFGDWWRDGSVLKGIVVMRKGGLKGISLR